MQSTLPQNSQRKRKTGLLSLVTSLLLICAAVFAWFNQQYIIDSIAFWQYEPTAEIEQIAKRTTLTNDGVFHFYAAQPTISSGESYNAICNAQPEQNTAIVGCYAKQKIYLYDVNDPRLDGIKDVTAAHEMLHAIYDRLSSKEKSAINTVLESKYNELKDDPGYSERMNYYARAEPGQKYNELHSIIGTERSDVGDVLEKHYRKYFHDRQKIVSLYEKYSGVFKELETKRKQLAEQLDSLRNQIEQETERYILETEKLSSDIDRFNKRAETGGFTSMMQFNNERLLLVDRSAILSSKRAEINKRVAQLNVLVDEYNQSVTQSNELYKSMNSNLSPAPKV